MKKYVKKFGKSKDNISIKATTFDGKSEVRVVTPRNPTNKIKEETVDFLLGELDDHDAFDEYMETKNGNDTY